jgi:hypothetical protein
MHNVQLEELTFNKILKRPSIYKAAFSFKPLPTYKIDVEKFRKISVDKSIFS